MSALVFLSLLGFVLFILPVIVVALTKRVTGKEKVKWVVITALVSWFGVIAFFVYTRGQSVDNPSIHS